MMSNDFEEAFSNFLERREYDEAESALFSMVRIGTTDPRVGKPDPPTESN